jgi:hypothetical protein
LTLLWRRVCQRATLTAATVPTAAITVPMAMIQSVVVSPDVPTVANSAGGIALEPYGERRLAKGFGQRMGSEPKNRPSGSSRTAARTDEKP